MFHSVPITPYIFNSFVALMKSLAITIGASLDPIEQVLVSTKPTRLLLFHLPEHPALQDIVSRLSSEFSIHEIHLEELPYPANDLARSKQMRTMFSSLNAFIVDAAKGETILACVGGGTKWMSHALHQVAFSTGIDLIVAPHPKFEKAGGVVRLPSILRVVELANKVAGMRTVSWKNMILELYQTDQHTRSRQEIADALSIRRQSVEHMYNGRPDTKGLSATGLKRAGVVEDVIIMPDSRSAPRKDLKLTPLGEEVARYLANKSL